jgi:hypothetical protein
MTIRYWRDVRLKRTASVFLRAGRSLESQRKRWRIILIRVIALIDWPPDPVYFIEWIVVSGLDAIDP